MNGAFESPHDEIGSPGRTANAKPTVSLTNVVASLPENTVTTPRIKVADIVVTDDGIGRNLVNLSGPDSGFFELDGTSLYLKAGTSLDFESKTSYAVTISVDDQTIAGSPDASTPYTLAVTNVNEPPTAHDDSFTGNQSSPKVIPAAALLANDTDPDAGTTLTVVAGGFSNVVGGNRRPERRERRLHADLRVQRNGGFKYTVSDGALSSRPP